MHSQLTRCAIILTVTPGSTVVAAPLTAYGAQVGATQNMWTGNDSGAQGMAWAYSKDWVFHAIQIGATAPTGYTVSLYGSNDPRALVPSNINTRPTPYVVTPTGRDAALRLPIAQHVQNGDVNVTGFTVPANSWVLLPALDVEVGAGTADINPITGVGQMLGVKRPLIAVRAVLTAKAGGAAGTLAIVVVAV